MTYKTYVKLLFYVVTFFVISNQSFAQKVKGVYTKEAGEIPTNFEPSKDTLLVLYDEYPLAIGLKKKIKSAFEDYKYPHKLISSKELENFDKSVYKFYLFIEPYTLANGIHTNRYHIVERADDVHYMCQGNELTKVLKKLIASLNQF